MYHRFYIFACIWNSCQSLTREIMKLIMLLLNFSMSLSCKTIIKSCTTFSGYYEKALFPSALHSVFWNQNFCSPYLYNVLSLIHQLINTKHFTFYCITIISHNDYKMELYTRTCFFRHSTYFTELCVENNTTPLKLGSLSRVSISSGNEYKKWAPQWTYILCYNKISQ